MHPTREALALAYWRTAQDLRLSNSADDINELADIGEFVAKEWPLLAQACLSTLRATIDRMNGARGVA